MELGKPTLCRGTKVFDMTTTTTITDPDLTAATTAACTITEHGRVLSGGLLAASWPPGGPLALLTLLPRPVCSYFV